MLEVLVTFSTSNVDESVNKRRCGFRFRVQKDGDR